MKKKQQTEPPRLAIRFLRWYCNDVLLEEIEGDLHELFRFRLREGSFRKAYWLFVWDVIRFFRWSNIKKTETQYRTNNIAMLRNYIKVSWRNLFRNAVPSFINIFGLSIAIGIAIVGMLYMDWQYSLDGFHSKSERIYQVISNADLNQQFEEWSITPIALGPTAKDEISAIEDQSRVERFSAVVRHEKQVFKETVTFVDPSFFGIFDYPLIQGDTPFREKNEVAISQQMAIKYFGGSDPLGQTLEVTINDSEKTAFTVVAVFDNMATRSSMTFNILLPYSNLQSMNLLHIDDWAVTTEATFVLRRNKSIASEVEDQINRYVRIQNEANENIQISGFRLQPLERLSVSSYRIGGSIAIGNQPMGNLFISIVGGLLLILACINYMNISIGSTANRLKEIALRKVIGGGKAEIIKQFLIENIFICLIALLLGTLLVKWVLLPGFNSQVPFVIPFAFSSNIMAVTSLLSLLIFTGLVSGAYPAFYISRFTAIDILKGTQKFGKKSWLSRSLLTLQFVLAFWTILCGLIFADVTFKLKDRGWGYEQDGLVVVPIKNEQHFEGLRNALSQQPGVLSVTGGTHHVGLNNGIANLEVDNDKKRVMRFDVGDQYLNLMRFKLVEGRLFNKDSQTDRKESIVVNESMANLFGGGSIVGKQVKEGEQMYTIVGMVEDFHYYNFYEEILPVVFHPVEDTSFNYFVARTESSSLDKIAGISASSWKTIEPDLPYEGLKQEQVFDSFYRNQDANMRLILFNSIVALVLACMGLFGLVTFNTNRRLKEFSIRRIFGASSRLITMKIAGDFFWLLVVGLVVGSPLAYISMTGLLSQIFPEFALISFTPLFVGVFFVLLTAIITVFSQIMKVIKRNPATVLRE